MAEAPTQTESDATLKQTSRGAVMLGELPNEFLQFQPTPQANSQVDRDAQIAHQLAAREFQQQMQPVLVTDRLFISVMEANLNKNYGMMKMDPYCRVRVNHKVLETDTDYNGAKNPHWTKPLSIDLSEPVNTIYIEIMDEKSLQSDTRIAWTQIELPEAVKRGEQIDDWFPLNGKLGDELEGSIHIVLSKKKVQQTMASRGMPVMYQQPGYPLVAPVVAPGAAAIYQPGMPMYYPQAGVPPQPMQQQQMPPRPQGPIYTEQDVKQLKEMFPNIEEEVVKSVLEASRGNKDAAINSLLEMQ